jgi:hypothetical protein
MMNVVGVAANVIFLESPTGVGFSYSNISSENESSGDARTGRYLSIFMSIVSLNPSFLLQNQNLLHQPPPPPSPKSLLQLDLLAKNKQNPGRP